MMQSRHNQQGLTLVEIMVAMTIGLLIMAGMANLFVQTKQSFRQDELIARMQEDARYALDVISQDVSMTGFWGVIMDGSQVTNHASVPTGASTANNRFANYGVPLIGLDNVAAGDMTHDWAALTDVVATTDVLSIRRLEGSPTADPTAAAVSDNFFMETNGTLAVMMKGSSATLPAPTGTTYWEYAPSIYYIRSFCRTGDGIPSLVKRSWINGVEQIDCIAQGIENMQIQYGLDTDGDGFADEYVNGMTAANAPGIATIRVFVLARSTNEDQQYTNEKTYAFANFTPAAMNDKFYRRVYSTTIQTRNPTHLRTM